MMFSVQHHGRGSEAKGMHFYLTIQLRQLQDEELMIPRNFVERYWKDVSNPISLRLPNWSACKMNWVQRGDDIWLQSWKRFARSLRCGDLLVFQYKGGSDFHVIILDDSKLEIDYSSMTCNDDQENTKESVDDDGDDDECVEIPSDSENTKIPLKKKRINLNDIATTDDTPQETNIDKRKTNINATQQKVSEANRNRGVKEKYTTSKDGNERSCTNSHSNENPSFTLKLSPYHVQGDNRLRIPNWFSKEYMNELLQGKATIRSVGEARAWYVTLNFDKIRSSFVMQVGWKSFSKEHDLKVGDVCKFEMTRREPLSFTITIKPDTTEPCPEAFQGWGHAENQGVQGKSVTTPVEDMEYVRKFGEGISNSCPKTHGLRNSVSPNLHDKFKVFVTSLDKLVVLPSLLKRHNIFSGDSVELKVGEGTWFVEVSYNQYLDYGWFTKGWQEFVTDCNVKIGDTCLFEMIDVQNHVFKVSIILDV